MANPIKTSDIYVHSNEINILLEQLDQLIEKRKLTEEPAIAVYLQVYRFLSKPDDEAAFQHFKILLKKKKIYKL